MNYKRKRMESFEIDLGEGTGETDHNEKGKYWSDNELSTWADQVSD